MVVMMLVMVAILAFAPGHMGMHGTHDAGPAQAPAASERVAE